MSQRALQALKGAFGFPVTEYPLGANYGQETLNLAREIVPDAGFDRYIGTDFLPIWEASLSAANTPTIDPAFTGGVVQFNAGGANQIALNPVTPGGATYNPIMRSTFASRAEPWFCRGRFLINSVGVAAAKELVLLSWDASYVGGGGLAHQVQLVIIGSTSPTQVQVRIGGNAGAAGPTFSSAGPDLNLGIYNSLLPVNQWVDVSLGFNGTNIFWMGANQFNPLNKLDHLLGQADAMGQDCGALTVNSSTVPDITMGVNFKIDALACAYCSTQGNL